MFKNLNYRLTEESITLFWDKGIQLNEKQNYIVYCNNVQAGMTGTTHYTVDGLKSETMYSVHVQLVEEARILAESEVLVVMTGRAKMRLDITEERFGAKGDGKTLNTEAIQKAIDLCGANECVYIPKGIFLTGALRLHSDMELYLEEDAVLQGTANIEDYLPIIPSRFEGIERECYSSVLNIGHLNREEGYNCENIVIRGKGTIASGGRALMMNIIEDQREKLKAYIESLGQSIADYENENTIPGRIRPRLINLSNARNITLSGLTFKDGASWNVHMIYSDNIVTHGCKFYSQEVWNGDGWDPDSSTNCTIFDCVFYTGDDSVAIKSGKNPEGNLIGRPTKHIRVFDCTSMIGHGISIGSELSGGIEDVRIWDCDMSRAKVGIEIKATKKRGGYVKDVKVENCSTPRLLFHSVGYNDDGIGAEHPPVFENCLFDNIRVYGEFCEKDEIYEPCTALEMCGFDEPGYEVKNVAFKNLTIAGREAGRVQKLELQYCKGITFENLEIM